MSQSLTHPLLAFAGKKGIYREGRHFYAVEVKEVSMPRPDFYTLTLHALCLYKAGYDEAGQWSFALPLESDAFEIGRQTEALSYDPDGEELHIAYIGYLVLDAQWLQYFLDADPRFRENL
ncbi:MAG: hypothetical protein HC913_10010 [Microscillaceae bacterium]|nr:hypothetical protein [Microscillaceae bacterium]